MREKVIINGVEYHASGVCSLRDLAAKHREDARKYEKRADEIEKALNEPEPLKAGDIVKCKRFLPDSRFVVLKGGDVEIMAREKYPHLFSASFVVFTDGIGIYSGNEIYLTRVGHISDVELTDE